MSTLYWLVLAGVSLWAGYIIYHELLPPPLDPPTEPYIPISRHGYGGWTMHECRYCGLTIRQNRDGQWYDDSEQWDEDMPDSIYVCLAGEIPGTHEPREGITDPRD